MKRTFLSILFLLSQLTIANDGPDLPKVQAEEVSNHKVCSGGYCVEAEKVAKVVHEDCFEVLAGGPATISGPVYMDPVTGEEVDFQALKLRGPASTADFLVFYEDSSPGFNPCQ